MNDQKNSGFEIELDASTAARFTQILNDESVMHAGNVAHSANNINNGTDEHSDF
jgi:hypothetical protein